MANFLLPSFARRLLHSAVLLSWMVTALRLGNVLLLLPVMLRTLAPEELGLWFVLLSFSQFFLLLEMGSQATLVRSASYFYAGATELPAVGLGSPADGAAGPNWEGLRGLLAAGRTFYRRLAVLAGILTVAISGGWLAWTRPAEFLRPIPLLTFGLLVVAGPLSLAGFHWNATLAGLNRVREAQAILLRAVAANYVVAIVGLLAGWGMLALAAGQVTMVGISRWESRRLVRRNAPELETAAPVKAMSWRQLWPMAWRTGAALLFLYLALPASLLVCGQVFDLRLTASFGLSLQAALLLHGVSANWVAVKYPLFGQWFAAGRLGEARALFQTRSAAAMATFIVGAGGAVLFGPWILQLLGSKTTFLSTGSFAALLGIAGLDLFLALHSSLLLTANRADHLPALAVVGLLNPPLAWLGAQAAGMPGLIAGLAVGYALMHLWFTPLRCWGMLRGRASAVGGASESGG